MTTLADIETPALLLERDVLARNLERMSARLRDLGVALRPHLKTAKSATIAGLATRGHPGGITVSTLNEAAYFAGHGFRDVTYAVGITPDKLERVASLLRDGATVRVLTDDLDVARAIDERGRRLGVVFPALIEIDSGAHRGGLAPEDLLLPEIARTLAAGPGARLDGVLTHAGHAYDCRGADAIRAVAEQERREVVAAAETLRSAGLACPVVSAGSTPTAVHAERLDGVTEMRPGNYMFFDLYQEGLGACRREDVAISVLASVIGRSPRHGRVLIDAGALALSLDCSAARWSERIGYGALLDAAGRALPGVRLARLHQEHGFVEGAETLPMESLKVGTRVRVLPNHACATAAMHARYHVIDDRGEIVDRWERTGGW